MDRPLFDAKGRFIIPRNRRRRHEIPAELRFLTFSCFKRLPLFGDDRIKDLFVSYLQDSMGEFRYRLIAWVVMPEHVHLLIIPDLPEHPVSMILESLKTTHARSMLQRWRQLEAPILSRLTDTRGSAHFWQRGGGYDRNIRSKRELSDKVSYIHLNPVKRGLVEKPTDWAWSSAQAYAGEPTSGPAIDRLC